MSTKLNINAVPQGYVIPSQSTLDSKGTYSKPEGGIPSTDLSSGVQTSLSKADTALQSHQDISGKADVSRVTAIEGLIPSGATSDNKLTDENFVNSSISTSTATFRGTVTASDDTESAAQTALATISTKDDNDYAFVVVPNTPQEGTDKYKRYKYNGSSWNYEYTLNNSSFTSAQWSAINSGVTSAKTANWDTAYGWGNHADAGYLAASTAASTYLPLSGGTMTGDIMMSSGKGIKYPSPSADAWTNPRYSGIRVLCTAGHAAKGSPTHYDVCLSVGNYYGFQLASFGGNNGNYWIRGIIDDEQSNWHLLYHSGNCNNTSTPWSASSLTLSGNLTTSGNILSSAAIYGGSIVGCNIGDYYGYIKLDTAARKVFLTAMQNNVGYLDTILCEEGGNVGIGTISPSYKLDVSGNIRSTGNIYSDSDKRLKDVTGDYSVSLDKVDSIPTVKFYWKSNEDKTPQVGTIAQDLYDAGFEEFVHKPEKEEDAWTVDYSKLSVVALAAIKELNKEIKSLKEEINLLKSKN